MKEMSWSDLQSPMADGPDPSLRGAIRSHGWNDDELHWRWASFEPWHPSWGGTRIHRWVQGGWDWALCIHDADDETVYVADLKRALCLPAGD